MLCTFILHLIFFLVSHTLPTAHSSPLGGDGGFSFLLSFTFILVLGWLGFRFSHSLTTTLSSPGRVCVLSLLLSFLFIPVLGLAWISFFSFFTHSTLLVCGRCFMLSTIPLHRILCCRRISSLLPCLLVCFRAKGCLMICFLFFRMSSIY